MHNNVMEKESLRQLAYAAEESSRFAGITQKDIAKAVNASQSQVSRILSGKSERPSRLFREICKYVENASRGVSRDIVRENDELMDAIASVWDGSPRQATAIATVIRSLGPLRQLGNPDSSKGLASRQKGNKC